MSGSDSFQKVSFFSKLSYFEKNIYVLKVEVCATHLQSLRIAEQAGADRIELCSELSLGGVTPSAGFMKKAVESCRLPIHCLIRPRSGEFVYSEEEFQIILEDIRVAKSMGVAGVVLGFLTANNEIDWKQLERALEIARPLSISFHRAFDLLVTPEKDMERLIDMGVGRILCTGKAPTAEMGLATLVRWKQIAMGRIEIQPGGGIGVDNCSLFVSQQFPSLHLSAVSKKRLNAVDDGLDSEWHQPKAIADPSILRAVVARCHSDFLAPPNAGL